MSAGRRRARRSMRRGVPAKLGRPTNTQYKPVIYYLRRKVVSIGGFPFFTAHLPREGGNSPKKNLGNPKPPPRPALRGAKRLAIGQSGRRKEPRNTRFTNLTSVSGQFPLLGDETSGLRPGLRDYGLLCRWSKPSGNMFHGLGCAPAHGGYQKQSHGQQNRRYLRTSLQRGPAHKAISLFSPSPFSPQRTRLFPQKFQCL